MGTVVTVTIGADTFSVYALVANAVTEATTYFNGLLGAAATAWGAATADNRARALVMAADWMDRALEGLLSGTQSVSGQPRSWPRDNATCNGTALADGTTPDAVARAQFWLAGKLLVDATLAEGTGTGSNVKQAQAGSASVTFFQPTIGSTKDTRLPITAMDYLRCFFSGAGIVSGAGVATGTGSDSAFGSSDFERTDGFN